MDRGAVLVSSSNVYGRPECQLKISTISALCVSAQMLEKRSPPVDPADYYISADKYYKSWDKKQLNPKKTFHQVTKARDKYFMLTEDNADEISQQAWKHHYELDELKEEIKKLVKKKDAANYKYDAYAKLKETNYAQRATNLLPVSQAGLYEAYQLEGLTGKDARAYVADFVKWGMLDPTTVQKKIKEQRASDPQRDLVVQQLQAAYLTAKDPQYFDLAKNYTKKYRLQHEWNNDLDRSDEDAVSKHQRNYRKVNLKEMALQEVGWDPAAELSRLYEDSYWRHVHAIREKIRRLKLMQAKQEAWTQAALEAGSYSVPPSAYDREDPDQPDVWEVEDHDASTSHNCYE